MLLHLLGKAPNAVSVAVLVNLTATATASVGVISVRQLGAVGIRAPVRKQPSKLNAMDGSK